MSPDDHAADPADPADLTDLTDAQSEQVRRLLAAAREPGPVPAELGSRLDAVLAGLVADRAAEQQPDVVALPVRPRRRWPAAALLAAAAVSVVAVGIGTVIGQGAGDSNTAGSTAADTAAERSGASRDLDSAAPQDASRWSTAPRLRSRSLVADVVRAAQLPADDAVPPGTTGCVLPPATPDDDVVAVRLDGRRATLVLGPPRSGQRAAAVYGCEDGALRASTEVPAARE